ncbi:MAG: allantoinase AllB [Alkalibacterium sp.]|nr:allantoinase AllB [Alkalibacterium sp.]TVP90012.1 MAG: allantoinase AllB [Alkalibacterium sp.]
MSFDLIVKNGNVILENESAVTDIGIKDGKIAEIGENLTGGSRVIEADGLIVSPGMVDAHVHITDPGGVRSEWEGYETGTRAAAKGGVTTFLEMPLNQLPATVDGKTLKAKFDAGKNKLTVDVASYGGLVPSNLDGGIQELDEGGVMAYKAFLSTAGDRNLEGDFENIGDYELYEGMKQIAETDKILSIHCENAEVTDKLGEIAMERGETSLKSYVETRPVFTEVEAIQRSILFAKETGCRLHIVHVACPEGVDEVTKAREAGLDVTCETCTHYLYFHTDELDDIGPVVKCSPPIRDIANREKMWEQLLNGEIDFVTSDHSPCTPDLKDTDNAFEAWGGISGLQNNVDVLFDEGVQKRGMTLNQFADAIANKPAKRFDLAHKGSITVGKDADFVFIKPSAPYTLKAEDLEYRNQISPYVGREIGCQVVQTILRGETIYDSEQGVSELHSGRFILDKNN